MTAEVPHTGQRTTVHLQRNGASVDIPIPFAPEDQINIGALWPQCAVLMNYGRQKISVYPHGTGQEIVLYDANPDPKHSLSIPKRSDTIFKS